MHSDSLGSDSFDNLQAVYQIQMQIYCYLDAYREVLFNTADFDCNTVDCTFFIAGCCWFSQPIAAIQKYQPRPGLSIYFKTYLLLY